jgi:hypothetical protein
MTARTEVRLFDKKKNVVLLHDTGRSTGMELAGKIQEIMV